MKAYKYISLVFVVCTTLQLKAQTQRIVINIPKLYPEGVAYDAKSQKLFVSSVKTGSIGVLDMQGNYKEFFRGQDLVSSFGMKVDPEGKNLWVCLSDPNPSYSMYSSPATLKKMARVVAIDIITGKKVRDINLEKLYKGNHFINDIAFDGSGNAYLTDSFSPVIYKIDKKNEPSVFAENKLFMSVDIGLNGIVYHPSGFLLSVNNSDGTILKIDANSKMVSKVKIDNHFTGADGLLLDRDNNLILVQNKGVNKVYTITSTDNWATAMIKSSTSGNDRFAQPSTAVILDGKVWALNSKLNELMNKTIPPSKEFSLQLAVFNPVN